MTDGEKAAIFSTLEFLSSLDGKPGIDAENVEVALQCLK